MTEPWGDPAVTDALRSVVDDLGRRTALDPVRLRAALNDHLGSRAHECRAGVDAVVVAADEQVPQALLAGGGVADRQAELHERGLQPAAVRWAVDSWAAALRIDSRAATALPPNTRPPVAAVPTADPELTALPETALPEAALPETALPEAALPEAALPVPTSVPAPEAVPGPGREPAGLKKNQRLLTAVGGGLIVVLLAGSAALANRGDSEKDSIEQASATTPVSVPSTSAPASTAPPSPLVTTPAAVEPAAATLGPISVLAHEGGWERYAGETLPAMIDAAERGATVETDVRWTSDGVAILTHDERVIAPMQCSGGKQYVIAKTTWKTLKKCRTVASASKDGKRYPIPTFAEAVKQVAAVPGAQLFAEVKVDQSAKQVAGFLKILTDNQMLERTVVTSFLGPELVKMRAAALADGGDLRLMTFLRDNSISAADIKRDHLWAVAVRTDKLGAGYVKALHRAEVKVVIWTINETSEWSRARTLGVDYVLTDRPAAYRTWKAKQ